MVTHKANTDLEGADSLPTENQMHQPHLKEIHSSNEDLYTLKVARAVDSYIDAFTEACSSTHKAALSASVNQDTIRQALGAVNVDDVLNKKTAYRIFCETYGIRQWFVAPEDGVRGLLRGALLLYASPLKAALRCAHEATVEAATHAAEVAKLSEADSMKHMLLDQALSLLDEWQNTTWEQLNRNIHAEAEFPAPDRFARLKFKLASLMAKSAAKNATQQLEKYKVMLMAGLKRPDNLDKPSLSAFALPTEEDTESMVNQWSEFYMGWLEKCNRRGMWQRRWFALSLRQQRIWWFGHPEEQPARGVLSLVGANLVRDITGNLSGQPVFRILASGGHQQDLGVQATYAASAAGEPGSHPETSFIGTRTKKNVASLTLRALSGGGKQQWCDMISSGISGLTTKETPCRYNLEAHPPTRSQVPEESEGIPRKISTRVFPPSTAIQPSQDPEGGNVQTAEPCVTTASLTDDHEEDEAERLRKEEELYEEIVNASNQSSPSPEEWEILECVVQAVREYLGEVQSRLTEQSAKLIADGMLPMGRIEDLHSALLKVLVPASDTIPQVSQSSSMD